VDESSLTGESVPVSKNAEEKMFMLSGCAVVEGDARYIVTAVGKYSEWGKIMTELDTDRPDTPLQVCPIWCVSIPETDSHHFLSDQTRRSCGDCGQIRPGGFGRLLLGADHHLARRNGPEGQAILRFPGRFCSACMMTRSVGARRVSSRTPRASSPTRRSATRSKTNATRPPGRPTTKTSTRYKSTTL
jgi:hypothetical protein